MNETIKTIINRRSTRSYKCEQIKDDELETVLEAGKYAPSGKNLQLWLFTAVLDRSKIDEMIAAVRETFANLYSLRDDPNIDPNLIKCVDENYDFTYGAPTLIILSAPKTASMGMPDCAAAIQNMMLAAESIGLGSCWLNQIRWLCDQPKVRAALNGLGIPESHDVNCSLSLGYIDKPATLRPRKENTVRIIR